MDWCKKLKELVQDPKFREDTRPPTLVYQLHGNLRYAKFTIQHQNVIIQEELMIDTGCVHWKCSSPRLT
ncbi:unnamed protein product [Sphagnum jensenii]|uniref:Uncharacterized protein n=1 Tax=Sphagnum jensenii TaxID=128206 RepID=A0ABP0WVQ8_9BRYO